MKFRNRGGSDKIETQMAPMIDVVFQLLIFFMLTLKIIEPEGDFNINMPLGQSSASSSDMELPTLKVRLLANDEGKLGMLMLGETRLGNDQEAFDRLNEMVRQFVDSQPEPMKKDLEVEIDADYKLDYEFTVHAISACSGKMDPQTKQMVRYIEKIKFAAPHPPS